MWEAVGGSAENAHALARAAEPLPTAAWIGELQRLSDREIVQPSLSIAEGQWCGSTTRARSGLGSCNPQQTRSTITLEMVDFLADRFSA